MEISAFSPYPSSSLMPFSRLPSSLAPFSDHGHILFYGPVFRRQVVVPSFARRFSGDFQILAPARAKQLFAAPSVPIGVAEEQEVEGELADMMARLNQKRKELKSQMKKMKKLQKEKSKKSKDVSSSSSSESELCDRECEEANLKTPLQMKTPQQKQGLLTELNSPDPMQPAVTVEATHRNPPSDILVPDCSQTSNAVFPPKSSEDYSRLRKSSVTAGKIEVCVGKSCKKAGSQQLLSSLRAQIPSDSAVEAVPCKCMDRCKTSINVSVQKEETNPLHRSHVGVQDASLLLSHHFDLGPPPTGLPSLRPQAEPGLAPQHLTASL